MYKIGFYNKDIEDEKELEECDVVFNDYDELKLHLRKEDCLIFKSMFSIIDIDYEDFLKIKNKFNLMTTTLEFKDNSSNAMKEFNINIAFVFKQYLLSNKDTIKKII